MMLDLQELANGMPAITPAFGAYLAQAGAVCLDSQGHSQGVPLSVQGSYAHNLPVHWPNITNQMLRCLNDPDEATEFGATGIAIMLIKKLIGFVAIQRARKGPGFDYWLGEDDQLLFQKKARLEVSGIRKGEASVVKSRVKKKLSQVTPSGNQGKPAYIVVVEFGQPLAEVRIK